ncbi:hypothetical protein R6Q59_020777 [Mikania micrantha]
MSELSLYKDYVQRYMKKTDELQVVAPPASKRDRISEMLGHNQNNKHSVRVPVAYKTKGSGSHKRMKSKQEHVIVKASKKSRQCQNCKGYGYYASTCKVNNNDK